MKNWLKIYSLRLGKGPMWKSIEAANLTLADTHQNKAILRLCLGLGIALLIFTIIAVC